MSVSEMYRLSREVRFSVSPFQEEISDGYNAYASRPCGEGLCLFLALWVEVTGPLNPETGFVINVIEIDKAVHKVVVPLFIETIQSSYTYLKPIGLEEVNQILHQAHAALETYLHELQISSLKLRLNPFRTLQIIPEDPSVMFFSEKFEFAATHKLWNDKYSKDKNLEFFGKCANPAGHGHNYILEVKVCCPAQGHEWSIASFQRVVNEEFMNLVDHKNLNVDLTEFLETIPSVENLAAFAWRCLEGKFPNASLEEITIWETDKTFCTYRK
ncbi:MAG: 6-carboxytetrahydropterin synthase [Sedimentisphaerales bacterium]|nr:6-carboxytetrahydropterin synthase [Sedimentisphaerales bacterium]